MSIGKDHLPRRYYTRPELAQAWGISRTRLQYLEKIYRPLEPDVWVGASKFGAGFDFEKASLWLQDAINFISDNRV